MSDELGPLNGKQSASKFESLIALDTEWYKRHKGNYVAMGSAVILTSQPTAQDAIRVGDQVAEQKGVRLDFFALVDHNARQKAIESRNDSMDLG